MNILSIRLTHHKTPNEFFHKIYKYFRRHDENIYKKLTILKKIYNIDGVFLLSTCHRMELYLSSAEKSERDLLSIGTKILRILFHSYFTKYIDYAEISNTNKSIAHLLAVTVGINSLIIGEVDIIEQVKESYFIAKKYNNTDKTLNLILEYADDFGRRLRKETKIETGLTSFASIPLEYLKNQHYNLYKRYIIIGSGMLGQRVIKNLKKENINNIFLLSRNYNKVTVMAKEFNITAVEIKKIKSILTGNDIIISCSAGGVIDILCQLKSTKEKKYCIFDFGIPPNIPKEIQKIREINYISLEACREIIAKDLKIKKEKITFLKNYIYQDIKNIKKLMHTI